MNKIIGLSLIIFLLGAGFLVAKSFLITGNSVSSLEGLNKLTLKVAIPCPGHAFLIEHYLNNLDGIEEIEYTPITTFVIYYDSNKTSEAEIFALDVFKDYPAKKIN